MEDYIKQSIAEEIKATKIAKKEYRAKMAFSENSIYKIRTETRATHNKLIKELEGLKERNKQLEYENRLLGKMAKSTEQKSEKFKFLCTRYQEQYTKINDAFKSLADIKMGPYTDQDALIEAVTKKKEEEHVIKING